MLAAPLSGRPRNLSRSASYLGRMASALRAAAGSAACWRILGSHWDGTANWGGTKSRKVSESSGRISVAGGGPLALGMSGGRERWCRVPLGWVGNFLPGTGVEVPRWVGEPRLRLRLLPATGPGSVWLGYGSLPQHLPPVIFSVLGSAGLEVTGLLLNALELVSDGLDGRCLLVGRLDQDRGLQVGGPVLWLVWLLGWVRLSVGCIWRGGPVVLAGRLAAPESASTAAASSLGRWRWRQRVCTPGLVSDPPGRQSLGPKRAVSVQGCRVGPVAVVAVDDELANRCLEKTKN